MAATVKKAIFVTGNDEAGVKKKALALSSELAPEADAFGIETIDGAVDTVDVAAEKIGETISSVLTLPFLGGEKLVWFKNVTFLGDTVTGRSETVAEAMEKLCDIIEADLGEGVTLLLSVIGADKRRAHYKRLLKCCHVETADLPDLGFGNNEEKIIDWIDAKARESGLRFGRGATDVLAARVGLDPMQLSTEFSKLQSAFPRGEEISADDIRLLIPQTREGGIFDLSGAIQQNDLPLALDTLAQLFYQREQAVGILLAAIVPTVRNLLLVKDLMVRHRLQPSTYAGQFLTSLNRLPAHEISHLPRKKDGSGINAYPLALASMAAKNFSLLGLQRAYQACAHAAEDLFKTGQEDEVTLSRLLIEILAGGAEAAR